VEEGLLFIHIIGAIMWLGGGIYATYAYWRIGAHATSSAGPSLNALAAKNSLYFGAANILVLGSGIALVATQDEFGWTDAFVLIGIGGILLSGAWQGLYAMKAEKQLLETLGGSRDPIPVLKRMRMGSYVDIAILAIVVYAMIAKWGAG
jgi:hypothetical protein